ncbi:MAG: thiamine pyrophosphate-binding protein [Nocardioides sp.]|uniref:thiamine pyrophosphate-binding protein n=1 Tax=Nocardioides sp. TaxID=35761 RepID=UPI0039E2728B
MEHQDRDGVEMPADPGLRTTDHEPGSPATDRNPPNGGTRMAQVLAQHGCSHVFTLMGDGNMHFLTALQQESIGIVEVRHESAAVAMAEGFGWAKGSVAICTVTHGPGFTHTATSLVVAARNRSPLVLVVAETSADYLGAQRFDQMRFAEACEVPYHRVRPGEDPAAALENAMSAALRLTSPVILGVASDLFIAPAPAVGKRSGAYEIVAEVDREASSAAADVILTALSTARSPVFIAGRGLLRAKGTRPLTELAEHWGAALATTVPAKGLFDGHPQNLGISGGLSHVEAETILKRADLVVAFGSSLDRGTTSSGRLFQRARILQVIDETSAMASADNVTPLLAEAVATIEELLAQARGPARHPWFAPVPPDAECWAHDLKEFPTRPAAGSVDPRPSLAALSRHLPADANVVVGNGHCSGFATTFVDVPADGRFFAAHGFGSIGQALPTATGAALATPEKKTVVIEGDAAFMMHLAEADTVARSGANLTVVVVNDGALGTEYQRLAFDDDHAELAVVGTPGLADAARALGARIIVLADPRDTEQAVAAALEPGFVLLELRTDRAVLSRHMRWLHHARGVASMD